MRDGENNVRRVHPLELVWGQYRTGLAHSRFHALLHAATTTLLVLDTMYGSSLKDTNGGVSATEKIPNSYTVNEPRRKFDMPKSTLVDWPFKHILTESSVTSLLPLQESARVAVVFDFGKCQIVVDKTVDMMEIDYNISKFGPLTIKWQVLSKAVTLEQLQDLTNSLVVRVVA